MKSATRKFQIEISSDYDGLCLVAIDAEVALSCWYTSKSRWQTKEIAQKAAEILPRANLTAATSARILEILLSVAMSLKTGLYLPQAFPPCEHHAQ
jgi:hypothetical protein